MLSQARWTEVAGWVWPGGFGFDTHELDSKHFALDEALTEVTEVLQFWPACFLLIVGSRDFTPLPKDALPAGRDSGGPERWQQHSGETGQEQTASPDLWERRETCPRAQSRQIRGVFSSDSGTPAGRGKCCIFPVTNMLWGQQLLMVNGTRRKMHIFYMRNISGFRDLNTLLRWVSLAVACV